jgi:hypothetical protein
MARRVRHIAPGGVLPIRCQQAAREPLDAPPREPRSRLVRDAQQSVDRVARGLGGDHQTKRKMPAFGGIGPGFFGSSTLNFCGTAVQLS